MAEKSAETEPAPPLGPEARERIQARLKAQGDVIEKAQHPDVSHRVAAMLRSAQNEAQTTTSTASLEECLKEIRAAGEITALAFLLRKEYVGMPDDLPRGRGAMFCYLLHTGQKEKPQSDPTSPRQMELGARIWEEICKKALELSPRPESPGVLMLRILGDAHYVNAQEQPGGPRNDKAHVDAVKDFGPGIREYLEKFKQWLEEKATPEEILGIEMTGRNKDLIARHTRLAGERTGMKEIFEKVFLKPSELFDANETSPIQDPVHNAFYNEEGYRGMVDATMRAANTGVVMANSGKAAEVTSGVWAMEWVNGRFNQARKNGWTITPGQEKELERRARNLRALQAHTIGSNTSSGTTEPDEVYMTAKVAAPLALIPEASRNATTLTSLVDIAISAHGTRAGQILNSLLGNAQGQAWLEIVTKAEAVDDFASNYEATLAVAYATDEQISRLRRQDLLPLVQSRHVHIRNGAIGLIKRIADIQAKGRPGKAPGRL